MEGLVGRGFDLPPSLTTANNVDRLTRLDAVPNIGLVDRIYYIWLCLHKVLTDQV